MTSLPLGLGFQGLVSEALLPGVCVCVFWRLEGVFFGVPLMFFFGGVVGVVRFGLCKQV